MLEIFICPLLTQEYSRPLNSPQQAGLSFDDLVDAASSGKFIEKKIL